MGMGGLLMPSLGSSLLPQGQQRGFPDLDAIIGAAGVRWLAVHAFLCMDITPANLHPSHLRRLDLKSVRNVPVYCNQGPPPPNPLVIERFQSVVSQLFQQVRAANPQPSDTLLGVLMVCTRVGAEDRAPGWGRGRRHGQPAGGAAAVPGLC